jgi:DNA repair exonuclease SbcCD nuclease subunit
MSKIAMLAMGDIHLERLIWRKHRHILDDSLVAFRSLVGLAIQNQVPLVLVGDIFDSIDPDPFLVDFFRREMERLEEANIEVYCIQGNHDKRQVPWYCAASSWPIHFGDGYPIQIGGLTCSGFDYAHKDLIQAQLAGLASFLGTAMVPDPNCFQGRLRSLAASLEPDRTKPALPPPQVLFLHQAVRQALRFDGAWNCDLDWVPDGIPLTVLGDIHKAQEMPMRNGGRGFYTGSTHPRSIEELGPKTCLAIHDDLSVTTLPLEGRYIQKVVLADQVDPSEYGAGFYAVLMEHAQCHPHGLVPVLWLRYTQDHAATADAIAAKIQQDFHGPQNLILIRDPMVLTSAEEEAAASDATDLPPVSDLLKRCLDPEKESFAYQFCLQLMEPQVDLPERIRDQRDRFLTQSTGTK